MTEFPEKIKSGSDYILLIVEDLEKNCGEYHHEDLVIKLDSKMPFKKKFKTFIHELLHHIDCSLHLQLPHRTIYALTEKLLEIFYDNPILVKLLDKYCHIRYNYKELAFKIINKAIEAGKK